MDERQYEPNEQDEPNVPRGNSHMTRRTGLSLGLRCFLLLILVISVAVFASRMIDYHRLSEQKDQLEKEKQKYEQQIEKMEHYLNGSIDYEDIIRIAREKYNLAFPDDTVIY